MTTREYTQAIENRMRAAEPEGYPDDGQKYMWIWYCGKYAGGRVMYGRSIFQFDQTEAGSGKFDIFNGLDQLRIGFPSPHSTDESKRIMIPDNELQLWRGNFQSKTDSEWHREAIIQLSEEELRVSPWEEFLSKGTKL